MNKGLKLDIDHRTLATPRPRMPSALRAEVRSAILDGKVRRADILRWVPQMNKVALAEFIETGRVSDARLLLQLEAAWNQFTRGNLTATSFLPPFEEKDPLDEDRAKALKKLMRLNKEEIISLGINWNVVGKVRHGEFPKIKEKTILKILAFEIGPRVPKAMGGYRVIERWWKGDVEYRKIKLTRTRIVRVKKDSKRHEQVSPDVIDSPYKTR
jgi:hypothetical protein